MSKQIAFLRAINVGGRRLTMDELRGHFVRMGFANVETFIASGNVIFDAPGQTSEALEQEIQTQLARALGYTVTTFLRTPEQVAAIAETPPFDEATLAQAEALNVAFIGQPLAPHQQDALMALRTDIDEFHASNREIYWLCRVQQSHSQFSNAVLERNLKIQATFRTINTLKRLAAKYA